jgi:riboflavin transporter FmnP
MNTKKIAIIVAFATLTIVLNAIRIPAFYWPGYYYRIYEIPMIVAFMLFGPEIAISVTVLNLIGQIILFPVPVGFVGYPFGVVAIITMMLGIYLGNRIIDQRMKSNKFTTEKRAIIYLTFLGIMFRATIMPFLDYGILYHFLMPFALGRTFTEGYLIGLIPGMVIFNATVPLYTIPISYLIARKVARAFRLEKPSKAK